MKTLYTLVGAIAIGCSSGVAYADNASAASSGATTQTTTTQSPQAKSIDELLHVTDATFEQEVLKAHTPVIVDFYATWCPPCDMLAPIYAETSKQYTGKVKFVKLDVDKNKKKCIKYGVHAIPALIIFSKGKEISRSVGYMEKDELVKFIDDAVKQQ